MSMTNAEPPKDQLPSRVTGALVALFKPNEVKEEGGEILEFYSPSAAVMALPPLPVAGNAIRTIFLMIGTLLLLFCTYPIDRVVVGQGKVVSLTPELVVQPMNPAIVKTIAVNQGDVVRKGQLLAQLDPTISVSDTTAAQEQVDRYKTEVDRLTSELHQYAYHPKALTQGALVQENIYAQRASARDAQLRYYQGQIDAQRALITQAEANIAQYAKETGLALDVEKIRHQLEVEEVGSRLDTLTAVNTRVEDERQVLTWIQQRENAMQTVASLQGQLQSYNQQWFADVSQNLTDDSVQLANFQDQLEHAALSLKLIDMRAQQDAIVLAVAPVSIGSVLQAGQTFFTLVPLNAPLEIDAQVTADQAGFVVNGMPTAIKFSTFPYEKFGEAYGAVRQVSSDSFLTNSPTQGSTSAGTTSDMVFTGTAPQVPYFYDVRATIDRMQMHNMPRDFHLVPGMYVELDIKVGVQTVMDYLFTKLMPVFDEGFREPT